jgi:predicted molibdopterin-dependent oxidoreductase YjgC
METISFICPGCSIGCGLYLVESVGGEGRKLNVAHRKVAPMNEGKLCKFGMRLPSYYGKAALQNSVDGTAVDLEEVVQAAQERLKNMNSDEIAFVTLPSTTTNEELVSFASLASDFGGENLSFGFERFFRDIPEEAFYVVENGLPFTDVETASKIVLFFLDPFVHYPLLARRILKAKRNGAQIIEVSFTKSERGLTDEVIVVAPHEFASLREKNELFKNSLIIGELTPYTNPHLVSLLLWLQASTSSRLFLLKPFLNVTGASLTSGGGKGAKKRKGLFEILDRIDSGKIKALYLLETDLANVLLGADAVKETLSKLDVLIEQNAFRTPLSEVATLTLGSEPFYQKKGTIVNIEGRWLELGGESATGLQILERMGKGRSYEAIHDEVKNRLGVGSSEPSEFEIAVTRTERKFEVAFLTEFIDSFLSLLKMGNEEEGKEEGYSLWYKTNPFFWTGIRDKQFVEISPAAMRALGLFSGDQVELVKGELKERIGFKISDVPNDLIVSEDKLAIQPGDGRWAELYRRELLTSVALRRATQSSTAKE